MSIKEKIKMRQREREILHNYLEEINRYSTTLGPEYLTGPMCELYDRLANAKGRIAAAAFGYAFIGVLILGVKQFTK